jgi:hypothetical protein
MITTIDLAAFGPVPMNVTVELPCDREEGTLARIAPTDDRRGAGLLPSKRRDLPGWCASTRWGPTVNRRRRFVRPPTRGANGCKALVYSARGVMGFCGQKGFPRGTPEDWRANSANSLHFSQSPPLDHCAADAFEVGSTSANGLKIAVGIWPKSGAQGRNISSGVGRRRSRVLLSARSTPADDRVLRVAAIESFDRHPGAHGFG